MIERLDLADRALAARVLDLQRAAYRVEADLIDFDGIPPMHESLDELATAPLDWLGVFEQGRLVAAMAITGEGRTCDIDRLMVDPAEHRRGHGRRLVTAVLPHAVVTVSTGERNTPAVSLYESLGFERVGRAKVAPGVWTVQFARRNHALATSFDADVDGYERARPGYPPELFDLLERHGLGPGATVVEIGPGTGQATMALLERGACVVAVEAGAAMAARLRARVAGRDAVVLEGRFEQVDAAALGGPFDLAVAATSFHWVDQTAGLARLARLLAPGRCFVPFWNVFRDTGDDLELQRWLDPIVARFQTTARTRAVTHALEHDARVEAFEASGAFRVEAMPTLPWRQTYDAAAFRALFASFSDWMSIPEPDRTRALDEVAAIVDDHYDGAIDRTYVTQAYVLRRTGVSP
ncbi:MAG: GNAT family N-acetyltransferase [Acidimicrobiales bacterium]|nr:GNAT family N-acetyltransferase [Acidimicrobiales bacterium]